MAPKIIWPLAAVGLGGVALAGGIALWRSRSAPPPPEIAARPSLPAPVAPALAELLRAAEERLASDPIAARAELGRLYHANGFLAEAEACWRELQRAQPQEARWAYLLADLRNQAGEPAEYEQGLRETVRLAPEYAPAWLKLAEVLFKTGRIDEAAAAYDHRLQLLPRDPHARLGRIRIARQRGQVEAAATGLAELVRDHRDYSPGHNLYAEVLAARGDAAAARRHRWMGRESGRFREADDPWLQELAAWCHDPKRLAVLGTAEFQLGRGDRGRSYLEKAVQLAPDDPGAHELLGDLLLKLGEPGRARWTLEQGLALAQARPGPVSLNFYVNLAEALRLTGEPEKALAILADGLARSGDLPELHLARGVVLDGLGRPQEAAEALMAAVARSPNDSAANYNLGVVLLQLERRAEAIEHLRRALIQQPTHPKALALLGQLELEVGRLEEAGRHLRPLYEANPGIPAVQELVAFWHLQSGLAAAERNAVAAAEQHYRDGLEAQPDNADLLISLGGLLLAGNRASDATGPLETYRRLRPVAAQGAFFLAQAYLQLGRRDDARRLLQEAEQLATRAGQSGMVERSRALLQQL